MKSKVVEIVMNKNNSLELLDFYLNILQMPQNVSWWLTSHVIDNLSVKEIENVFN